MTDRIEVLGCVAKLVGAAYEARTLLGTAVLYDDSERGGPLWVATWWPKRQRAPIRIVNDEPTPAAAAREATRRLRAIQRTCARAGAL